MASAGLRAAKASFFDKAVVIKAIGRVRAAVLSKSANKLKVIAQRSMRYVDPVKKSGKPRAVSKPGEPPKAVRSHPFIRKFLYAIFDLQTQKAVIGPIRLSAMPGEATKIMEHGGMATIRNKRRRVRRAGEVGEVRIGLGGKASLAHNTLLGTVPVAYARLTTPRQVVHSNRINEQLYGPATARVSIAARPFMRPALTKTATTMAKLWLNSVKA